MTGSLLLISGSKMNERLRQIEARFRAVCMDAAEAKAVAVLLGVPRMTLVLEAKLMRTEIKINEARRLLESHAT